MLTTAMVIILLVTNPHVGDVLMTMMQDSKCPRYNFWSIQTIVINCSRYFSNNINEAMMIIINSCEQAEDMDVDFKKSCLIYKKTIALKVMIIASHL